MAFISSSSSFWEGFVADDGSWARSLILIGVTFVLARLTARSCSNLATARRRGDLLHDAHAKYKTKTRASTLSAPEPPGDGDAREYTELLSSPHSPGRQTMLALARLVDHISYVQVVPDSAFDLNQTIFVSVTGAFTRAALKATTGNQHFWEEGRLMAIQQMYLATQQQFVPRPVADGSRNFSPVLEFMQSKCNFKMEHADGSFYDHLFFVRDYSALHYPQQSPKILFLHSIMGVATNLWPMEAKNVPALQKLLTKEEFFHIAAFPTVLRLIKGTDFLLDLYNLEAAAAMATSGERSWKKLRGLRCMRMLDGEAIEFESMEALYTHLNFHAIHLLDFLPLCGWRANWARPFVHDFLMLFAVLKALGKLEANIDVPAGLVEIGVEGFRGGRGSSCDGGEERMILRPVKSLVELYRLKSKAEGHGNGGYADVACDTEGQPSTAMHILMRSLPRRLLEKLQRKQVARFTKEINRSLKYEWVLENVGPSE
eukprot:CAMPEP_0178999934 /NCGR_PEP_ID=MMETSP0795-20121207/10373_1 /TAXON_ID=88552 /ORGANISM="Amoebophrya sp., Strain Ameob2" /LENGTH=485 /DNA_ID=CAMNT_0020692837 /DNA_START=178 /DNA_END=1635 /DNA_ORIENTATION=+